MTAADPVAAAQARYARVQAAMARRRVGALLLATPHLGTFASGARRVQVAGSGGPLPWVVIPAGARAATVFTPDPDGALPWTPREAIEPLCWDRERHLERLRALVASTEGPLASDVFSPALAALAEGLARQVVDAAPVIADAVAPRTTGELALIGRALAVARGGVRAATGALAAGVTVSALRARAAEATVPGDVGFPLCEALVWRAGTLPERLRDESVIGADDPIAVEIGVYVAGHAGLMGDTAAAGGGRLASRRRAWSAALCAIARRCRAGATTADVRAAAAATGATAWGLLAHGLGVGIEPPLIAPGVEDDVPLAAGTVLVLAPAVDGFRASRALVVTEGAARWLEPAP